MHFSSFDPLPWRESVWLFIFLWCLIYCLLGCLVVSGILWVIGSLVNGFIPACHTKEHKRKWVPLMASSKAILSWQMPYRDWLPFRYRLRSLYSVVELGVILAWVTCVTHQYVLDYKTVRKIQVKIQHKQWFSTRKWREKLDMLLGPWYQASNNDTDIEAPSSVMEYLANNLGLWVRNIIHVNSKTLNRSTWDCINLPFIKSHFLI